MYARVIVTVCVGGPSYEGSPDGNSPPIPRTRDSPETTCPKTTYGQAKLSSEGLLLRLMKNWLVAVSFELASFASPERAMATDRYSFSSPVLSQATEAAPDTAPPWITKLAATRWNEFPS